MKKQLRSLSLIAAFVIGGLFHEQLAGFHYLLNYGLGIMLFLTFVGIETNKLKVTRRHFKLLLYWQSSAVIMWLIPALLGYPILAESFFYIAAAPLATASPIIVALLKGKVEFITTAMVITQIVFSLLLPFILPFVVHGSHLSYWSIASAMLQQLVVVVILPAILACILRVTYPKSIKLRAKCVNLSLVLWVSNLSIVTALSLVRIKAMDVSLLDMLPFIIGAAIICALSFTLGFRLGKPDYQDEFSQACGQKNTILSLMVATHDSSNPLAIITPTFYIIFQNIANSIQIILAQRREEKSKLKDTTQSGNARNFL